MRKIKKITTKIFMLLMAMMIVFYGSAMAATQQNEQQESNVTVLDNGNASSSTKIEVQELSIKDYMIAKLREAHAIGKFMNLKEEDIRNLTDEEIGRLMEMEANVQMIEASSENAIAALDEKGKKMFETIESRKTLSNPDERMLQSFNEYIQNKKAIAEAGGWAAVTGATGIGLVLTGQRMLNSETAEEKQKRLERLGRAMRTNEDGSTYLDETSKEVTNTDIIMHYTETALNNNLSVMTQSQVKRTTIANTKAQAAASILSVPLQKQVLEDQYMLHGPAYEERIRTTENVTNQFLKQSKKIIAETERTSDQHFRDLIVKQGKQVIENAEDQIENALNARNGNRAGSVYQSSRRKKEEE